MKYKVELLQLQRVFENSLKKKYKSIKRVEVNPERFEEMMDRESDYVFTLDIDIYWDVRVAVENDESFTKLTDTAKYFIEYVLKRPFVVPWINLKSEIK
jgi:hypothetical protein